MTVVDLSSSSRFIRSVALALVGGLLLRGAVSLTPLWYLAWVAPIPLLWLVFAAPRWQAATGVLVAALIAHSVNLKYFRLVAPWPVVCQVLILQASTWLIALMFTRYVVLRHRSALAVVAYPMIWVGIDTLQASFLPDGNWGSLAYSQASVPPLLQVTAVFGLSGLLFLLCLVPSTLVVCTWHRRSFRAAWALGGCVLAVGSALGFGAMRLSTAPAGAPLRVGVAAIDEGVDPDDAPARSEQVRAGYDALVAQLAAQGAALIVLPEKLVNASSEQLVPWREHFSELATRHRTWIALGIGHIAPSASHNYAWLFDPSGRLVGDYEKHFLAPPERMRRYVSSDHFELHEIGSHVAGLAICKDMHFAALGRDYGRRGAGVMLVPAWDFDYLDAWLAARMTLVRGVENGYTVIRSAREGLLTVSDAHGRVLAETRSAKLPGASLVVDVPLGPPIRTLYTQLGDVFGWISLVCALAYVGALALRGRFPQRCSATNAAS